MLIPTRRSLVFVFVVHDVVSLESVPDDLVSFHLSRMTSFPSEFVDNDLVATNLSYYDIVVPAGAQMYLGGAGNSLDQ